MKITTKSNYGKFYLRMLYSFRSHNTKLLRSKNCHHSQNYTYSKYKVRPANLDDLFCSRKHLYRFMPARKHLHNCIWTERRNEFFGLFLIYYNHKKLETHISRANEDTSKLEPPNVIAFKRQQAHLAHKEAFLLWNGGRKGTKIQTNEYGIIVYKITGLIS